ncbi:thiol reductant ABC exporter subunit CydD [Nocardioides daejeonensis]|uniref:thiol reductant ABC exporter subunit CydD n=1 Tax=Nocardioides daejeonensis TaxID=1046556 RepID=UPI000D74B999|nr:thiol reductant ABC exporter subunit CydD [Nocardioides daejeonensis]
MKPVDPQVLPLLRPAVRPLSAVLAGNVVVALLVVGQAFAVASLVAGLLADPTGGWQTPALWVVAFGVARYAVAWVVEYAAARAATRVGRHLREQVLRHTLELPATSLATRRTGALATLATRGVTAVEPYVTRYLPALVLGVLLPVVTVIAIATQDLWSALIVVATLPLVPVFAVLVGMATRDRADREWRALSQLAGHFLDVVKGLPTLVTHRRAHAQVERIREVTDRYRRASRATLRIAFASSAVLELIATISVALVAVCVGLRLAAGGLELQVALTVLLLAPEAYWPLRRVGAEFHAAAEGTAAFEEIRELLASPVPTPGDELPTGGAPTLELRGLAVGWPERPAVVRDLTATLPPGVTAVVGPSGCGKSTLLQALLGELPAAQGRIFVNGLPLDELDPMAWRAQVAYLPQRPWLTPEPIAANLRFGAPEASDAQLWHALEVVGLRTDVLALPAGLETPLGEDGAGLSAGQRARLAVARVLLSDRPVVLLDEPSAHLDPASEALLLQAVADLGRTRTVLVVAHRPAVESAADQVLRLPGTAPRRNPGTHAAPPLPRTTPPAIVERRPLVAEPAARNPRSSTQAPGRARLRWSLAVLLGVLAAASGVALTATAGWLIARSAEQPPVMVLTVAIVGVRTFGLARPVLRWLERLLAHDVALQVLADRRAAVYAALVPLAPARLGRRGDLLGGVVDDVDALVDERLRVRLPILVWLGVTTLASGVTWWILPAGAPVVAAVTLVGGLLAYGGSRLGARRHETALVGLRGDVGRRVHDLIADARPLVQWQQATARLTELTMVDRRLGGEVTASARTTATARAGAGLLAVAGVALMALMLAQPLSDGAVSAPMAALALLLPLALVEVTAPLADAGALAVRTRAARARLDALTAQQPAVADPEQPRRLPEGPADVRLVGTAARWEAAAPRVVLPDLHLEPGTRVGVQGPSGSGKSTLAAVLARHIAPETGRHTVHELPCEDLLLDDVRATVGHLADDPHVFASSVAENVRLARPGATDDEVRAALTAASLAEWVDTLPDGIHTHVGEGAAAVSGGERARLGVARALLADTPVLVLDEPTAHLDVETADAVAATLLAETSGRSLVWISHDGVGQESMDALVRL